ncbi:EG45-like domain containing protein isoform X2 [Ipomoea triloba]|uniref:EG45-like domain containing protein isoform X2 n=1 Tax=Ipomoea triloba TaxID=35885 RepID=UPI00125DCED5|nr:EG45-like domain containing protein isoform X2 [Ipomoea triloba]
MAAAIYLQVIRITVIVLLTLFSSKPNLVVLGDIGTATSYNPPYSPTRCNGNRVDQFPAGNLFVAVSEGLWDNGAACGRRYRLSCLSGNNRPCKGDAIDVRVVDFCPKRPCPSTILLSKDAFSQISHSPHAKINIEYIEI